MTEESPEGGLTSTDSTLEQDLSEAADAALTCWTAAAMLRTTTAGTALTTAQLAVVRGWKAQLRTAAVQHLANYYRSLTISTGDFVSDALIPWEPRATKFTVELLDRLLADESETDTGNPSTTNSDAFGLLAGLDGPGSPIASVDVEYHAVLASPDGTAFDPAREPRLPARPETALGHLAADTWELTQVLLSRLARADRAGDGTAELAAVTDRMIHSVLRPLSEVLALPEPPTAGSAHRYRRTEGPLAETPVDETLWHLAVLATDMRPPAGGPAEMIEVIAGLQDLACRLAPEQGPLTRADRIRELRRMQPGVPTAIEPCANGPYLVSNVDELTDWLGVDEPMPPQLALCRCGASASKPFCDGAHARTGFTDGKDPARVPDRRDSYPGLQATILDNRGTCAHSGFCTDRLSSVFRLGEDPFVLPSGGRLDEITQAVRACPSGALSMALGGDEESHDVVDQQRPANIEVSRDGPYRVTGSIPLTERDGKPVARNQGASLEHYSLCRCGRSQNKPFCSGMHWYADFHDPVRSPDQDPTLFEWAGGLPALRRMTRIFYGKYVPQDELLTRLFADMRPDHPERVATWLAEVFGGPSHYTERYGGYTHMISEHIGKRLTEPQRRRWAALMGQAADDAGLPNDAEFRAAFTAYLEWGTRIAVENSQTDARPPEGMKVPRWWWVCDATPSARISALAPVVEEDAVVLPGADEPLSFERHIKQLFRAQDRNSMRWAFDLWDHADVSTHADSILHRVNEGTMPCDSTWPAAQTAVFSRWIEEGKPS
ncbi:CDGSH iron-sulfur domain-containing protein [Actinoplanes sp. NPDC026623]|uniref:CDGSH iron-sulfur domain-containing protein n=1 Tax=Actinoplanes sp. NPDC026623 TaxID=3155610 RepID=UPI0033D7106A